MGAVAPSRQCSAPCSSIWQFASCRVSLPSMSPTAGLTARQSSGKNIAGGCPYLPLLCVEYLSRGHCYDTAGQDRIELRVTTILTAR
jgi:hypothetical protein